MVGAGNLGRALVSYGGFATRGFRIVGVVDADPEKIGTRVAGHTIVGIDGLPELVQREKASIAVIATPAEVAQEVADQLVRAGVRSILNFAPAHIDVPDDVQVRKVDLSTELQILTYYEQQRAVPRDEQQRAVPRDESQRAPGSSVGQPRRQAAG